MRVPLRKNIVAERRAARAAVDGLFEVQAVRLEKYVAAVAYLSIGEAHPMLVAEAEASGSSIVDLCRTIIARRHASFDPAPEIERQEMQRAIDATDSAADLLLYQKAN